MFWVVLGRVGQGGRNRRGEVGFYAVAEELALPEHPVSPLTLLFTDLLNTPATSLASPSTHSTLDVYTTASGSGDKGRSNLELYLEAERLRMRSGDLKSIEFACALRRVQLR
jgi:hypothetical protein